MKDKEILDEIKSLSIAEQRNLSHEELIKIMNKLSPEEIM